MLAKVLSFGLVGIKGFPVEVEIDVSNGLPYLEIVGLPDNAVKESKERVRSAIKNSRFDFPGQRITINLAPADTKKEGSVYDLPIAIGILTATGQIPNPEVQKYLFFGELSLNGEIRPIRGVLPMVIAARENGYTQIILPKGNEIEGGCIEGVEIYPVASLSELVLFLKGENVIEPKHFAIEDLLNEEIHTYPDFSYIKGQKNAKRAIEIAAAGGHNLIMIGSPGSGKTMLARSIPSILPDLTMEEALEVTKIHSVAGILKANQGLVTERPFRAPHHSVSTTSLIGGGRVPKPGEISLAHFGVLFLDELPEFHRDSLEALRQPLEDEIVTISRINSIATYPSKFMLVSSMNPCPCGRFSDPDQDCRCTPLQIQRYLSRISGPLLDRIDIQIQVDPVSYHQLEQGVEEESSIHIKKRVNDARKIQLDRYNSKNIFFNSQLDARQMSVYCNLDQMGKDLLKKAFTYLKLSARAYNRILKVARTIADLDAQENITVTHIAEAIQYRSLDRKFWG